MKKRFTPVKYSAKAESAFGGISRGTARKAGEYEMKNITKSLIIIGAVAALAIGGTIAYFSDTEQSTGNTFTAGTIDIAVTNPATWRYDMTDMKPSQVDYTNFTISNATGNNPVNVWKKVSNVTTFENDINEPEQAYYTANSIGTGGKNDIDSAITYDLSVVLKDSGGVARWNQTLYNMNKTITEINAMGDNGTFLGMIPEGWSMDVTESYHMKSDTGNWAQSDSMTFDITLTGEQLKGTAVLENKDQAAPWRVLSGDSIDGTLTYGVKDSKFNYSFTGKALLANTNYSLIVYAEPFSTPTGSGWPRQVIILGSDMSDGAGVVNIPSTSLELGTGLINAKVWLVQSSDLDGNTMDTWNSSTETNSLFDTGLIDYYDTDL